MSKKTARQEKTEHSHTWVSSSNDSEKRCGDLECGAILVSEQELLRRRKEWELYYKKVLHTHAYRRFHQQRIAFKLGDVVFVNECTIQAKKDLDNKLSNEVEKPHFPDPSTWNKYELDKNKKEEEIISAAKTIFNV